MDKYYLKATFNDHDFWLIVKCKCIGVSPNSLKEAVEAITISLNGCIERGEIVFDDVCNFIKCGKIAHINGETETIGFGLEESKNKIICHNNVTLHIVMKDE